MTSIFRVLGVMLFCFVLAMSSCPTKAPFALGALLNLRASAQAAGPTNILWDYDFTKTPACSTTVTTNCVSGFQEGVFNGSSTQLVGPVNVPLPTTILTTGPTLGISTPFNVPAGLGNYTIQVAVAWKDSTGTQQYGPSAAYSYPVIPGAVANLRVQ